MSAQPESSGGLSRDYIVEYRAGQFQNGSLVLRFDAEPNERQLREALIAYGLPARALEEVRARPLQSSGPRRSPVAQSSQATLPTPLPQPELAEKKRPGCSGGRMFMILLIIAFGAGATLADNAKVAGMFAGDFLTTETMVVGCANALGAARAAADPGEGFIGALLSQEPTAFAVTPANAAFYVSCLSAASG
ncbi:hypothetical protein NYP18_07610 [Corynebacterium sp. YIM 101645]|uniref:Uncharacterized protein n=1 Tax=Corynebacterium lemuris TaxID=1859292 RepID=A0ABT2FWA8_9CORY|nr:hypothetical protein [Corynebacterium lemuris]MCS5479521.1 hypothetical protein [Corynebacterium lemuris]